MSAHPNQDGYIQAKKWAANAGRTCSGSWARLQGHPAEAVAHLEESLAMHRALGDQRGEANVLTSWPTPSSRRATPKPRGAGAPRA